MTDRPGLLFSRGDLRAALDARDAALCKAIDSLNARVLLSTSVEELAGNLETEYVLDTPVLREVDITTDQQEVQIDVSQDPFRPFLDRSRPAYIKGTSFSFFVPFEGDAELFRLRPSTWNPNPPRAEIRPGELVLHYPRTDQETAAVRREFDHDLAEIRRWLTWVAAEVDTYNHALRDKIVTRVTARRDKLLQDQASVAALGFPVRRRTDAPQTYVAPQVRRKAVPASTMPATSGAAPEPALAMNEYDHVLTVMRNMVLVIERSPATFRGMQEEDLRNHLLVQLNGQYEGQATGETFNASGKTDILIRIENRNIFIAECKFWEGPASLTAALDQLLSYATWRDGKLALVIFNRRKDLSAVLAKIPETVRAHSSFRREVEYDVQSGSRFVMTHPDDSARELHLTILVFEVPT